MCHAIPTVGKSWQRQGVLSFPSKIITTELDSEDTVTSSVRGLQLLLGLSHLQLGGSWKTAFISPEVASQWNSRIAFETHASLSSLPSYYAVRAWQLSSVLGQGALHDVLLHGINLSSGIWGVNPPPWSFLQVPKAVLRSAGHPWTTAFWKRCRHFRAMLDEIALV